jgi:hypothetical protein
MGSVWGDSGDGGASDAAGEPDSDGGELEELVVELADDDALPGETPNSATSERETIRGGGTDGAISAAARIRRLPRAVRVGGVVAVAVMFAFAVWPASGGREAAPRPVPTPSQVNLDLYKVRLRSTSLATQTGADHAVLGLELTNSAATRLEVVSAELWDAVGTRLGSAAGWPAAQDLGAGSTVSVPVTLPYACDAYGFVPVLPITVRYSISTPQSPGAGHDYAYPLTDKIWDTYVRQRATQCTDSDGELFASAIDTTQPIGAPIDSQGFDLTFTIESTGSQTWSLDEVTALQPGVTINGTQMPVTVSPGQTARVSTHWHIDSCEHPPRWGSDAGVRFTAHATGTAAGSGAATHQMFNARLRPGLATEMLYEACGI